MVLSVRFSSRHSLLRNRLQIRRGAMASFQSAFHRGTHCYSSAHRIIVRGSNFQSAFHRGTHCYQRIPAEAFRYVHLSVRFSSRHSLLQRIPAEAFRYVHLSVRFSSRHSLLPNPIKIVTAFSTIFQSAFHRGTHCYWERAKSTVDGLVSFSPLFIAALTATTGASRRSARSLRFQSAFHRGTHCYYKLRLGD